MRIGCWNCVLVRRGFGCRGALTGSRGALTVGIVSLEGILHSAIVTLKESGRLFLRRAFGNLDLLAAFAREGHLHWRIAEVFAR